MSEELKIIANDDGTFSEYDDTFDITIHCQSEEEQNEVLAKLNAQEPCGDCISREAALDDSGLGEFHRYDDYVKMRNYLKSLPSVSPQPKMGRWVKTIGENGVTSAIRCSECSFEDNRYKLFDYCPVCGVKMQEVEE